MRNKVIVFDLDDTFYKEKDYLISGYKKIVSQVKNDFGVELSFVNLLESFENGDNVFENISDKIEKLSISYLLDLYRYHIPDIKLDRETNIMLKNLKSKGYILGIITDGRSITQRNKLEALGIINLFDSIIISEEFGSEKPDRKNYLFFEENFPKCNYYYIGDNIKKDFITPNVLGWKTIGVRDCKNKNIHPQNIDQTDYKYLPNIWLDRLSDLGIEKLT